MINYVLLLSLWILRAIHKVATSVAKLARNIDREVILLMKRILVKLREQKDIEVQIELKDESTCLVYDIVPYLSFRRVVGVLIPKSLTIDLTTIGRAFTNIEDTVVAVLVYTSNFSTLLKYTKPLRILNTALIASAITRAVVGNEVPLLVLVPLLRRVNPKARVRRVKFIKKLLRLLVPDISELELNLLDMDVTELLAYTYLRKKYRLVYYMEAPYYDFLVSDDSGRVYVYEATRRRPELWSTLIRKFIMLKKVASHELRLTSKSYRLLLIRRGGPYLGYKVVDTPIKTLLQPASPKNMYYFFERYLPLQY